MHIKKLKLGIAAGLFSFGFSMTAQAESKELPFPNYPAKFGKCITDNERLLFATAKNEGVNIFGTQPIIQTPKNGVHAMVVLYHPTKDYGYTLSDKADGKLCVSQKLTDYTFKAIGNYSALSKETNFTKAQCNFTQRYSETCGTFKLLSGALISKGFEIDYQAINKQGDIETLLSGNGKSYRLTTNKNTGATVITGNGTQEFVFHKVPEKPRSN